MSDVDREVIEEEVQFLRDLSERLRREKQFYTADTIENSLDEIERAIESDE